MERSVTTFVDCSCARLVGFDRLFGKSSEVHVANCPPNIGSSVLDLCAINHCLRSMVKDRMVNCTRFHGPHDPVHAQIRIAAQISPKPLKSSRTLVFSCAKHVCGGVRSWTDKWSLVWAVLSHRRPQDSPLNLINDRKTLAHREDQSLGNAKLGSVRIRIIKAVDQYGSTTSGERVCL